MDADKYVIMSQSGEIKFDKNIEENLVNNKECKILQCHLNDYTDCLKLSFAVTTYKIIYRINIFQTRPDVRKIILGHCDKKTFETFVNETITQFTQSVNNTKVCDHWETTFIVADIDSKRHNINTWEGEHVEKFVEIIDEITQVVVKNVS